MPVRDGGGAPARAAVLAAFCAIYVIWGSTYLAIRFAIETLPPFLMAGTRFLIAGAVLYVWTQARGAGRPTALQWRRAAVIGAFLLLGGNGLVVWAEQWVASGVAALLVATVPFWMVLMEWARRGGSRPAAAVWTGLVLGFCGIAMLIGPGSWAGGGVHTGGAVALVVASLSWAAGSIYARSVPQPSSAVQSTAMQMLAGGALLLGAGLAAGEAAQLSTAAISARSVAALAYLVVFGSLIGFTAYIWLLGVSTPARVSTYAYVNPVVAVLLGWALAGEALTGRVVVATAVIVAAVAVITAGNSRRPQGGPRSSPVPSAAAAPAVRPALRR